jgi:predicted component of type VI protein secretion system
MTVNIILGWTLFFDLFLTVKKANVDPFRIGHAIFDQVKCEVA